MLLRSPGARLAGVDNVTKMKAITIYTQGKLNFRECVKIAQTAGTARLRGGNGEIKISLGHSCKGHLAETRRFNKI